jgi:purine-binding chemotaxis protein CheW
MPSRNQIDLAGADPVVEKRITTFQIICFSLADAAYGIDLARIQEIIRPGEVPDGPGLNISPGSTFVYRGQTVPLIDLRKRLGFQEATVSKDSRIVIVAGEDELFGALVDYVIGVLRIPFESVEKEDKSNVPLGEDVLKGIYRDDEMHVRILDCARIFRA